MSQVETERVVCLECGAVKGESEHASDCLVLRTSGYDPDCRRCWRGNVFGPTHNGSRACRNMRLTGNGAIAAGGDVPHCTCAGCF